MQNNKTLGTNNILPERLRQSRIARDYTTEKLADLLEITRQAVSQYELGHAKPINQ